jgi:hypothetical protein
LSSNAPAAPNRILGTFVCLKTIRQNELCKNNQETMAQAICNHSDRQFIILMSITLMGRE